MPNEKWTMHYKLTSKNLETWLQLQRISIKRADIYMFGTKSARYFGVQLPRKRYKRKCDLLCRHDMNCKLVEANRRKTTVCKQKKNILTKDDNNKRTTVNYQ